VAARGRGTQPPARSFERRPERERALKLIGIKRVSHWTIGELRASRSVLGCVLPRHHLNVTLTSNQGCPSA